MSSSANSAARKLNYDAADCTVMVNNGKLEVWSGGTKVKTFATIPNSIAFRDQTLNIRLGTNGNDQISAASRSRIILGLDGNDTITATGGDKIIGGPGNDLVVLSPTERSGLAFSCNSINGKDVWSAALADGQIISMYDVQRVKFDSTAHALKLGTAAADSVTFDRPVVFLGGDGNDIVTGAGGYFDLGNGDDALISISPQEENNYFRASRGNDTFQLSGVGVTLDYSNVGRVDMTVERESTAGTGENGSATFSFNATKQKGGSNEQDTGTFTLRDPADNGMEFIFGNGGDSLRLINNYAGDGSKRGIDMGGGDDTLTIGGESRALDINMGKGHDEIHFERNTRWADGGYSLYLRDWEKIEVSSERKIYLNVDTSDVLTGMTIDLENRTAQTNYNQWLTWDQNTNVLFDLTDAPGARIARADTISGGTGNDEIQLGANDCAYLGDGNDYVGINIGNNAVSGGDGNDMIDFSTDFKRLNIDVDSGSATFRDASNRRSSVSFSDFEQFKFKNGTFKGSNKSETIIFGEGNSKITGNGGNDTFIFVATNGKADITDFARGDKIDLSKINDGNLRRRDFEFIFNRNTFSVNYDNGYGYTSSFKITAGNNYQFQQGDIKLPDGWGWQT
jgi:Ca2+-binding RTX toxin-like protein